MVLALRANDIGPPVWTKGLLKTPVWEFVATLSLSGIHLEKGPFDKVVDNKLKNKIKTAVGALKNAMSTEKWEQLLPTRNLLNKLDPEYQALSDAVKNNAQAAVKTLHGNLIARVKPYNQDKDDFCAAHPTLKTKKDLPQRAAFGTTTASKSWLTATVGCITSSIETMNAGRNKMKKCPSN